ncbi:immunity 49 family protein [Kitasatospora albolonga]|uniref:immunity 49 family protein n=1 Tax=Kitasatospora albolonga TaxID=68173 RepID=UPI0035EF9CF3
MVVARHAASTENVEKLVETLDGILQRAFRREPLTVLGLSMATDKALILARKRALLDPAVETVESWYAWTAAMQASSAVFAAVGTGGSVVVRLGSAGVREVQAVRPDHYTDAGSWLDAFWLAVVCREARRLDLLASVPIPVLRESGAVFDDYIYSWVRALQEFRSAGPELMGWLEEALEGADPEVARIADREILVKLLYPPIVAFFRLVQRDAEKFNEALLEAVRLHKEFWTADEERIDDSAGFVSLPLTALASLAEDLGIPVKVESDYLPKRLVLGSWVGEFDT